MSNLSTKYKTHGLNDDPLNPFIDGSKTDPTESAAELSMLRQQSMKDFVVSGREGRALTTADSAGSSSSSSILLRASSRLQQQYYRGLCFERDARLLSHPVYPTLLSGRPGVKQSLSSVAARMCAEKLHHVSDVRLDSHLHLYSPMFHASAGLAGGGSGGGVMGHGLTCISFDNQGALFAVAGAGGVLRVYDFDECYAEMHLR